MAFNFDIPIRSGTVVQYGKTEELDWRYTFDFSEVFQYACSNSLVVPLLEDMVDIIGTVLEGNFKRSVKAAINEGSWTRTAVYTTRDHFYVFDLPLFCKDPGLLLNESYIKSKLKDTFEEGGVTYSRDRSARFVPQESLDGLTIMGDYLGGTKENVYFRMLFKDEERVEFFLKMFEQYHESLYLLSTALEVDSAPHSDNRLRRFTNLAGSIYVRGNITDSCDVRTNLSIDICGKNCKRGSFFLKTPKK